MTQGKLVIGMILLALLQLVACERNTVDTVADKVKSSKRTGLAASKQTGIKRDEPVIFTLTGDVPISNYRWEVTPLQYVSIMKGSENTKIMFNQPGKYTVIALDSITLDSAFIDVEVGNDFYQDTDVGNNIPQDTLQSFHPDDMLSLTPVVYPDSAFYLEFLAETKNTYACANNYLTWSHSNVQNSYKLDFTGVMIPAQCAGNDAKPTSKVMVNAVVKEHTVYNLEIIFKEKTYKGSFERTGGKYQFTWPYTDGVRLTTKSI